MGIDRAALDELTAKHEELINQRVSMLSTSSSLGLTGTLDCFRIKLHSRGDKCLKEPSQEVPQKLSECTQKGVYADFSVTWLLIDHPLTSSSEACPIQCFIVFCRKPDGRSWSEWGRRYWTFGSSWISAKTSRCRWFGWVVSHVLAYSAHGSGIRDCTSASEPEVTDLRGCTALDAADFRAIFA